MTIFNFIIFEIEILKKLYIASFRNFKDKIIIQIEKYNWSKMVYIGNGYIVRKKLWIMSFFFFFFLDNAIFYEDFCYDFHWISIINVGRLCTHYDKRTSLRNADEAI